MSNIKKYHGLLKHKEFGIMLFTALTDGIVMSFEEPDRTYTGFDNVRRFSVRIDTDFYGNSERIGERQTNQYVSKENFLNDNSAEILKRVDKPHSVMVFGGGYSTELVTFDEGAWTIDTRLESVRLEIKIAKKSLENLLDCQTELILKKYDVFDKDIKDKVRTLFKAGLADAAVRVCQKHHNCDHAAATEHVNNYVFN